MTPDTDKAAGGRGEIEALLSVVKDEQMKYRYAGTRPSPGWTACENIKIALYGRLRAIEASDGK